MNLLRKATIISTGKPRLGRRVWPAFLALLLLMLLFWAEDSAVAAKKTPSALASAQRHGRSHAVRTDHGEGRTVRAQRREARTETARVTRVVDGDTLRLDDGVKVRLLGVDTPETKHPGKPRQWYGKEASAFTKKLLTGRRVLLQTEGKQMKDRYGRMLAYVSLSDGTDVNAELVRQGYAQVYRKKRCGRQDELLALEREAKKAKRGMWAHPERVDKAAKLYE